jgi:hypothetical protein
MELLLHMHGGAITHVVCGHAIDRAVGSIQRIIASTRWARKNLAGGIGVVFDASSSFESTCYGVRS